MKYFEIVGLRSQVFRELESILRSPNAKTPEGIRNASLLVVARPLFSFVKKLPRYTLNTTRISSEAQQVLKTLQKAQEPDELLFVSLPEACGFEAMHVDSDESADAASTADTNLAPDPTDTPPQPSPCQGEGGSDNSTAKAFRKKLVQCLHEIQTAYDCLLTECQERLHEVFGVRSAQAKLREDLRVRAQYLRGQCIEPVLKRFVLAAADETTSDKEWLEALMMIVVDKPPKSWRDDDISRLDIALSDLVRRFQNMEALQKEVAIQGKGFEAVRITQTESTGDEIHEVVPIELSSKDNLEALADRVLKEALICGNSRLQKEFVAILNRKVFETRSTATTDDLSAARQHRQQAQLSSM